ncbi:MAG: hypothetical protein FJX68_19950, partial [Alphaproteobacteria bacterium]|nr:hypothetical protein [Alphaproteobacteria bacterium]
MRGPTARTSPGAAREDAIAVTQAIVARPRIAGSGQEAGIGRLALDAAAGLGVSVGDAANRIADLYQKGVPALKALDDQINFLTASER